MFDDPRSDWKRQFDKEEQEKREQESHEQLISSLQVQSENLRTLQSVFSCNFCGTLPQKPALRPGPASYGISMEDFWDLPGDLYCCKVCFEWACEDHFHQGYCKKCIDAGRHRLTQQRHVQKKSAESWLQKLLHILF
jgi:hypothetical protein